MSDTIMGTEIPNNIPIFEINEKAYGECEATLIRATENLVFPSYHNGMRVTKTSADSFGCKNCESVKSVVFPEKLKVLGYGTLSGCVSLEEIEIPEGVVEISKAAFYGCHSLKRVKLPSTLSVLGEVVFGDCPSLVEIEVAHDNRNFTAIDGVLYSKDKSVLIDYPMGKSDKSFTVPPTVVEIGPSAFAAVMNLQKISIPRSTLRIKESAFSLCISLESIEVSEENEVFKSIDGNLYSKDGSTLVRYAIGKPDESFVLPEGVKTIDESACAGAPNLRRVVLPIGLTNIEYWAFAYCKSLVEINIPSGVKYIGDSAFMDCSMLPEIWIPKSAGVLGVWAFSGCDSLTISLEADEESGALDEDANCDERPVTYGVKARQ